MKFYIISLVLNALLVFIPLGYVVTQGEPKTETMNVSLEDNNSLGNAGNSSSGVENGGAEQSKQPENSNNSNEILQNKTEKSPVTETSQNKTIEKKPENSSETTFLKKNSDNTGSIVKNSGNQAVSDNGTKNGLGTAEGKGNGSENGSKTGKGNGDDKGTGTNTGKNTGNDSEKNSNYVCTEGKGYRISYNPNLETPQAAERLGKKGSVTVSISFNASGSITVHGAKGGNDILQSAAKKAAQGIRVTILDSQVTKCKVSKTFNFK